MGGKSSKEAPPSKKGGASALSASLQNLGAAKQGAPPAANVNSKGAPKAMAPAKVVEKAFADLIDEDASALGSRAQMGPATKTKTKKKKKGKLAAKAAGKKVSLAEQHLDEMAMVSVADAEAASSNPAELRKALAKEDFDPVKDPKFVERLIEMGIDPDTLITCEYSKKCRRFRYLSRGSNLCPLHDCPYPGCTSKKRSGNEDCGAHDDAGAVTEVDWAAEPKLLVASAFPLFAIFAVVRWKRLAKITRDTKALAVDGKYTVGDEIVTGADYEAKLAAEKERAAAAQVADFATTVEEDRSKVAVSCAYSKGCDHMLYLDKWTHLCPQHRCPFIGADNVMCGKEIGALQEDCGDHEYTISGRSQRGLADAEPGKFVLTNKLRRSSVQTFMIEANELSDVQSTLNTIAE